MGRRLRRSRTSLEQRVDRLLRWYPAAWRARYGTEFRELLVQALTDHHLSWQRRGGVVGAGLLTRARMVLPGAYALDPVAQTRAGLGAVSLAGVMALVVGAAMWSQLIVGWEWAAPTNPGPIGGLVGLSAGVALLSAWSVGCLARAMRDAIRQRQDGGARRVLALFVSVSVLVVAGRHFANSWPGTGGTHGHPWSLLPAGVSAFIWACTRWISSYWAHPASLASFPAGQLAWMVLSPIALGWTILKGLRLVQHRAISAAGLRTEGRLSLLAVAGIVLVALGGLSWAAGGHSGPHGLFRAGALDGGLVSAAVGGALFALLAARALRHPQPATPG